MERRVVRDAEVEVEVTPEETGTGPRLRIHSMGHDTVVDLDPLELEGLTRLPFVVFTALEGASDVVAEAAAFGPPPPGMSILRNEFAMVGVGLVEGPEGSWLHLRDMASGAQIRLGAGHLDRLTRLRHRDLAPLVDPSGLLAQHEPDPDQV